MAQCFLWNLCVRKIHITADLLKRDSIIGKRLLNSEDRQLKSLSELELILSVLRHQLGNSVNALKITLDVLRENFDIFNISKKKEYLDRAAQLIGRQQEIIQALKLYSMFSVEDKKPIAFSAFWMQLLPLVTQRLAKRRIRLITRYESIECTIWGNLAALNKVVLSILDNALEALDESNNPAIEIYTAGGSSVVRIGIKDNGAGCRSEDVEKLFVPLFTTRPGKTGMGLALARKLTSEMDGNIVMKSSPDAGSEVVIRFSTRTPDDLQPD